MFSIDDYYIRVNQLISDYKIILAQNRPFQNCINWNDYLFQESQEMIQNCKKEIMNMSQTELNIDISFQVLNKENFQQQVKHITSQVNQFDKVDFQKRLIVKYNRILNQIQKNFQKQYQFDFLKILCDNQVNLNADEKNISSSDFRAQFQKQNFENNFDMIWCEQNEEYQFSQNGIKSKLNAIQYIEKLKNKALALKIQKSILEIENNKNQLTNKYNEQQFLTSINNKCTKNNKFASNKLQITTNNLINKSPIFISEINQNDQNTLSQSCQKFTNSSSIKNSNLNTNYETNDDDDNITLAEQIHYRDTYLNISVFPEIDNKKLQQSNKFENDQHIHDQFCFTGDHLAQSLQNCQNLLKMMISQIQQKIKKLIMKHEIQSIQIFKCFKKILIDKIIVEKFQKHNLKLICQFPSNRRQLISILDLKDIRQINIANTIKNQKLIKQKNQNCDKFRFELRRIKFIQQQQTIQQKIHQNDKIDNIFYNVQKISLELKNLQSNSQNQQQLALNNFDNLENKLMIDQLSYDYLQIEDQNSQNLIFKHPKRKYK